MFLYVVYLWKQNNKNMGYTTDFDGELQLSKNLTPEQFNFINKLNETRRMRRDVTKLMERYKGKHGYPGRSIDTHTPEEIYGNEGEYFVGGEGYAGQDSEDTIIDYNTPPGQIRASGLNNFETYWEESQKRIREGKCQPGLWLQWKIEEINYKHFLMWDGGEKFYYYVEWLNYLITQFFDKWDVKLNGEIKWKGEDSDDIGKIIVDNNEVRVGNGRVVYDV